MKCELTQFVFLGVSLCEFKLMCTRDFMCAMYGQIEFGVIWYLLIILVYVNCAMKTFTATKPPTHKDILCAWYEQWYLINMDINNFNINRNCSLLSNRIFEVAPLWLKLRPRNSTLFLTDLDDWVWHNISVHTGGSPPGTSCLAIFCGAFGQTETL